MGTPAFILPIMGKSRFNAYSNLLGGVNEFATLGSTSSHKFLHGGVNPATFAWTITLWVKFTSLPSGINAARGWFSTGTSSSASVGLDIYYSDAGGSETRSLVILIANASGSAAGSVQVTIFTNVVPDNTNWHHYALTYNIAPAADNLKVYVDGVFSNSSTKNGTAPSSANSAFSPRWGCIGNGVLPFAGYFFYPKIFNKEFSAAEVLEDYNLLKDDVRDASYAANNLNAHYFPTGQAGFPTWTDLIGNNNATMTNQEATDIDTTVPP